MFYILYKYKGQKENKGNSKMQTNPQIKVKPNPDWGLAGWWNMRWRIEYGGHISLIFIFYTIKDIHSSKEV